MWELFCAKIFEKTNLNNCEHIFIFSPDFYTAYKDSRRLHDYLDKETQGYTVLEKPLSLDILQTFPMETKIIFHNGCLMSLGEMLSGYCRYMSYHLRA